MTEQTHTPGPHFHRGTEAVAFIGVVGRDLAKLESIHLRNREDVQEFQANLKLWAAAPDLLAALTNILKTHRLGCNCDNVKAVVGPHGQCDECEADAAIAKAKPQ